MRSISLLGTYDTLYNYLDNLDRAAAWAKSILVGVDSLELDEPVLLPDSLNKSLSSFPQGDLEALDDVLTIFPNPAKDHLTVSYRVDRAFKEGKIRILDQLGQVLYFEQIKNSEDQVILRPGLREGFYLLEIQVDGATYRTESLVIQ